MAEYIVADTTVVSKLTKASVQSAAYQRLLGQRRIAVAFPTLAELLGAPFGEARMQRARELLAVVLKLRNSEATSVWFARIAERRRALRKSQQPGSDASDNDVWIIAASLEYGFPLLSHDDQQVQLGRSVGVKVLTNLDELKDDNPTI
jgi:predicted nucleic acid-binding protein